MTNDLILRVEEKMITLRGQQVILDSDVAELYGVATKEINQAVRNNPKKFPEGYIWTLEDSEKDELVKILTGSKNRNTPRFFRGLLPRGGSICWRRF